MSDLQVTSKEVESTEEDREDRENKELEKECAIHDLPFVKNMIKVHQDMIAEEHTKYKLRVKDINAFNFDGINDPEMREKFRLLSESLPDQESRLFVIAGLKQFLVDVRDKAIRPNEALVKEYEHKTVKLEEIIASS
jgi:hypothetical protein